MTHAIETNGLTKRYGEVLAADDDPAKPWYNALVLLDWSAVSLALGYATFARSELQ